ncbi:hypothetical protein HPB47_008699 [Ixodes persulcatus]|uniref:Uncharacterized protein n=1 Tax=Ixodes persulcatus TaxID=34615 RepID=A0AC60P417_IXOPE|nr:hypothetical protein HPB47_008699 [Ixodes persulcatus]
MLCFGNCEDCHEAGHEHALALGLWNRLSWIQPSQQGGLAFVEDVQERRSPCCGYLLAGVADVAGVRGRQVLGLPGRGHLPGWHHECVLSRPRQPSPEMPLCPRARLSSEVVLFLERR